MNELLTLLSVTLAEANALERQSGHQFLTRVGILLESYAERLVADAAEAAPAEAAGELLELKRELNDARIALYRSAIDAQKECPVCRKRDQAKADAQRRYRKEQRRKRKNGYPRSQDPGRHAAAGSNPEPRNRGAQGAKG
jgi:hypothetical protein